MECPLSPAPGMRELGDFICKHSVESAKATPSACRGPNVNGLVTSWITDACENIARRDRIGDSYLSKRKETSYR